MNNVAFWIFGMPIYWYGLIIMCGMVIGMFLSTRLARKRGYNSEMILDFLLLAVPLGIIGARLYYVVFSWDEFANNLGAIFSLRMVGLAIYGAVIGGIIAAIILAKWRKMSVWDIVDCAAPSLLLAQGLGRWGNFFNQELYGAALTQVSGQVSEHLALFPPAVNVDGQWYVGLFLIESIWNICGALVILYLWKKKPQMRGGAFWLYMTLYCSARAILEGMRQPEYSLMIFGTIRVSQAVSAVMAVVAICMFIYVWRKGGYKGPAVPERYRYKPKQQEA